MKRKAVLFVISIVMLTAAVGGCWNYVDVDTQFVVMGVVIDYDDQTEEYILYAEVAKAKGGTSTEQITRIESFRGATIFEASRNAIMKIGAKLYWGHTMVYAISEKVARDSISDVMSLLSRQTQIRSDLFVIVCADSAVSKFFEFDDPIHASVSEHIYDLLLSYKASGKFKSSPLFKVLQELSSEDITLMLPYLKYEPRHLDEVTEGEEQKAQDMRQGEKQPQGSSPQEDAKQQEQSHQDKESEEKGREQEESGQEKESEEGKQEEGGQQEEKKEDDTKKEDEKQQEKSQEGQQDEQSSGGGEQKGTEQKTEDILVVDGSAVFRKATMVGKFSEIDTRSVLILKGEITNRYALTYEQTKQIPSFSVEVIASTVSIEPELKEDGHLKVKVEFKLEGDLVEIQTLKDFIKDDRKKELETAFNKMMSEELLNSLKRSQGLSSDVFGIAGVVHRKMPDYYKKVKFDWEKVLKRTEFLVQTELNISSSSLSMNPIKVGR